MNYQSLYQLDQDARIENDYNALDHYHQEHFDRHSEGKFDGKTNCPPSNPGNDAYWQGYTEGLRSYWDKQSNSKKLEKQPF